MSDSFWRVSIPKDVPTPATLSHSGLGSLESCPRRWWLGQSAGAWGSHYPSPLGAIASRLKGRVIHGMLERLIVEGAGTGQEALRERLRVGGGWRARAEKVLAYELRQVGLNPRVGPAKAEVAARYFWRECFAEVQGVTLRMLASVHPLSPLGDTSAPGQDGAWPEREVRANLKDGAWYGKVDLAVVEGGDVRIIDFKSGLSGGPSESRSKEQVLTYAALWREQRGGQRFRLQVIHPDRVQDLGVVSGEQLDTHRAELEERGRAARAAAAASKAQVGAGCAECHVRQACADYWASMPAREGPWQDVEGVVEAVELDGLQLRVERSAAPGLSRGQRVMVERGASAPPGLAAAEVGARLRLLDAEILPDGWLRARPPGIWGGGEAFTV